MNGPLGDLKQYQQALDEAFEHHEIVLAYLYGSQARGDAGPLSDVDVAVQFAPDLPRRETLSSPRPEARPEGSVETRFSRMGRLTSNLCQLLRREDVVARYATERELLEVAIQRVLNVATHVLTADFAIPADDYAGVIRALGKAGVLPADFAERFTAIVGFRNVLTELYVEVDPVKVYEHLQRDPDDIRFFVRCIVEYLEKGTPYL